MLPDFNMAWSGFLFIYEIIKKKPVHFSVNSLSYMYLNDQWASAPGPYAEHTVRMDYLPEDIDRILGIYTEDLVTRQTYFIVLCQRNCLKELLYQVVCILGHRTDKAIQSRCNAVKFLQMLTIYIAWTT